MLEYFIISSTMSPNSFGPREQLTPKASTPNPSKVRTIDNGVHPVKVLLFFSKVIVQNTGRFVFSFAAKIAALAS